MSQMRSTARGFESLTLTRDLIFARNSSEGQWFDYLLAFCCISSNTHKHRKRRLSGDMSLGKGERTRRSESQKPNWLLNRLQFVDLRGTTKLDFSSAQAQTLISLAPLFSGLSPPLAEFYDFSFVKQTITKNLLKSRFGFLSSIGFERVQGDGSCEECWRLWGSVHWFSTFLTELSELPECQAVFLKI